MRADAITVTPMQWIICYDIGCHRSRRRALRLLRRFSGGYQKSGFELLLFAKDDIVPVLQCLYPLLCETDRLLVLRHAGKGPDWKLGNGWSQASSNILAWT